MQRCNCVIYEVHFHQTSNAKNNYIYILNLGRQFLQHLLSQYLKNAIWELFSFTKTASVIFTTRSMFCTLIPFALSTNLTLLCIQCLFITRPVQMLACYDFFKPCLNLQHLVSWHVILKLKIIHIIRPIRFFRKCKLKVLNLFKL